MISGENLLIAYAVTGLVACIMPGPAVMTVMSIALDGYPRSIAAAIAGINAGNILWYIMVGAGLMVLVRNAPGLFELLGWAGTVYLFWLGVQTLRSSAAFEIGKESRPRGVGRAFAAGIAMQLSNPKALVFFTVFLPPFIDTRAPVAPQLVLLATIGIVIEVATLGLYASLAYRLGKRAISPASSRMIPMVSGGILLAIAVAMALSRLP